MSFCIKKYLVFSLRKSNNTKYYRTQNPTVEDDSGIFFVILIHHGKKVELLSPDFLAAHSQVNPSKRISR